VRHRHLGNNAAYQASFKAREDISNVTLADPLSGYVSGCTIAVTGRRPIL
jgi:hypothetical protein